jgi:FkbH-like protein
MQPIIETLSIEEKRALLASLVNQNRLPLQLSTTQERLWQLCQVRPDTAVYNFQTSLELHGRLFPPALEVAALRVILRHRVLQVSYGMEKGRPSLSLVPARPVAIAQHDLSGLPRDEQERRMEAIGRDDAQRIFDLGRPPLLRLTLVRLSADQHRLYLTMHHIVSDFLSLDLFLFEMGEFYTAALENKSDALPALAAGYQEFAKLQRTPETAVIEERHLGYWRRALAHAQPMEWFGDHTRPATSSGNAETEFFYLPGALMQQVEAFARERQVTPFMVLLAGFNILLHAGSGRQDLLVGSPMAGRIRSEYESLIGMFSYPVLMRTSVAGCRSFNELLQTVRKVALEAAEHGDVPFAKVAGSSHAGSQGSLLRAMFSYVSRLRPMRFEGVTCRRRPTNRGVTDLDLFLTIYPDMGEWHGVLEYNTDLFERNTIQNLAAAYVDILQAATAEPELSVEALAARVPVRPPARLNIAATFTADPLLEVLSFWARDLDLPFVPDLAPYNQMLQQLLDPRSPLLSAGSALNILLVRPQDWIRSAGPSPDRQEHVLQRTTQDFIAAVGNAAAHLSCSLKIYLCPASPQADPQTACIIAKAEQSIREAFVGASSIAVLDADACIDPYSVAEVHDPHADQAANIPYTPAFYAALGTAIVRQLRTQIARACKVLVLDCDNTLWQGLCAEEGPQGVVISDAHRALQKFVLQQAHAGVLVCLNSKNAPEYALAVFRENPGMILKESDITAHRINWEPKSSNLESLAEELQLDLDAFVFIDDDARECAEVSARCPQVLALRAPQDPAELLRFLQHLWIFDRKELTEEDRRRTGFYRDNQRRDLARRQSASLAEFLSTLELQVELRRAEPADLPRIAQLSQRTNQFNASSVVFDSLGLQRAVQQGCEIAAIEVRDRFGDYGLAGAVVHRSHGQSLTIEAFYLSCRVLGRGVEQRILSELGRIAEREGASHIDIHYNETSRNQAFRRFLDRLAGRFETPAHGPCTFVMPVADGLLAEATTAEDLPANPSDRPDIVRGQSATTRYLAALANVPHALSTSAQILARIHASNSSRRDLRSDRAFVAPQGDLESEIAAEWSSVLRVDQVGRNDNFFELGGNSLLIVQLNGNLIGRLGVDISIAQIFQYPTVASLAAHIAGRKSAPHSAETGSRGARIRAALQERKRQFAARQA